MCAAPRPRCVKEDGALAVTRAAKSAAFGGALR
jgi:hypothetical protein